MTSIAAFAAAEYRQGAREELAMYRAEAAKQKTA